MTRLSQLNSTRLERFQGATILLLDYFSTSLIIAGETSMASLVDAASTCAQRAAVPLAPILAPANFR
jgi:hypothetical protein